MPDSFITQTQELHSILDFLRFGLSKARAAPLYYGHGTDNAWDDIVALIYGTLSLPFDMDPVLLHAALTKEEKVLLLHQLEQRINERIPVPYLTHQAYFCDLSFYVDARVLIPRSPIAELIKHRFSPWIIETDVHRILDLCTGSGCIAIACSYWFEDALVDAIDISPAALEVAQINRTRHGLEERLRLIESDCFEAVEKTLYDIIVSNPPYVGQEEMQTLPAEYYHEPSLALEASHQGLAMVEKIIQQASSYLSEHGILVVEVGNSEALLVEKYPHLPFTWLDFEHGGQGVFLLTKKQMMSYFKRGAI